MNINQSSLIAPPLNHEKYATFYQLRNNASTVNYVTIQWFRDHLPLILNEVQGEFENNTLSVLSIGCGEGDIDIEIIKILYSNLNTQWNNLQYDAFEPNAFHKMCFLDKLKDQNFNGKVKVNICEESFSPNESKIKKSYDLILFIQVLYYFPDPFAAIKKAFMQTKLDGKVIIIHQSNIGIPELQEEYSLSLKGNKNEMLNTVDIRKTLHKNNNIFDYCYQQKNAHLNITECLNQTEDGLKILSFCMECDLHDINQDQIAPLLQSLKNKSILKNKKKYLYEPIGIFTLQKNHYINKSINFLEDDSIESYRQLLPYFNWKRVDYEISKHRQLRLLDIACGTGQWIHAFHYYIKPKATELFQEGMRYDLVNNSEKLLQEAIKKIDSPLILGNQYVSSIQDVKLENNAYDMIFSMHGFYTISPRELNFVIKKLINKLSETGVVFITQFAQRSFLIDFYTQYIKAFNHSIEKKQTVAEDITQALEILNIEYKINVISFYKEIKINDFNAIRDYIFNEDIVNLFSMHKSLQLQDVLNNKEINKYLKRFIKNGSYHFLEETWLIEFEK
jgi:SAM-dependent methyltransferase